MGIFDIFFAKSKFLFPETDRLRRGWLILDSLDVDSTEVNVRSAVFQRELTEGDVIIPVHVKIYTYRKHPFQRLWRRGRSRLEARNLLFFESIGILAPRVLGWGQHVNRFGKVTAEFIITETIQDALPLHEFVPEVCPDTNEANHQKRRNFILDQLGSWTGAMHDQHFFHKDLKWRNILGRIRGEAVELFWIDCPKGDFHSFPLLLKHRMLKDCATLDKLARLHCSNDERRRFIAGYLGASSAVLPEVEAFARSVSRYRRKRFDPEDDRQRAHASGLKHRENS